MKRWMVLVLALLGVIAAVALWLLGPWGDADLSATPDPAQDYRAALARIESVKADDVRQPEPVAERGMSYALLHGSQTTTSVVIFHGYTSCPKAFRRIAQGFYDAGYNVWVPRAPKHGYRDYLTDAHASIRATELRDYADDAIDVAAGLGENVVVIGQSGGGMLAMWALAERPEVDHAVAVSPFLHPKSGLPVWQMRPLGRLSSLGALQGMWKWWDPVLMDSPERQRVDPNAYPRGSVNALMQYLTVGRWLKDTRMHRRRPEGTLMLLVNEHDPDIDADYNLALARDLAGDEGLSTTTIPDREGLGHDLCDPEGTNRPIIRVAYAYLAQAFGVPLPDPLEGK